MCRLPGVVGVYASRTNKAGEAELSTAVFMKSRHAANEKGLTVRQ